MNSLTSSKIILSREREESNDTWLCVAAVAVGAAAAVNVNVKCVGFYGCKTLLP